jgi:hypothetical protein
MINTSKVADFEFSTSVEDYPEARAIAERVISDIKAMHRAKSLKSMLRYSRGSVLVQDAKVLTRQMMDEYLLGR